MPVFYLDHPTEFPPTHLAEEDGLLAVGGDLSTERLIAAYTKGIFPWFNEDDPYLWWSPAPRFILLPEELHISRSMRRKINKDLFKVTFNHCFDDVITNCQQIPRSDQPGTWITDEMKSAYIQLHKLGYAHSVEVWNSDRLVGGIYGIAIGQVFFGESMFSFESNASKYGIIHFIKKMPDFGLNILDCQMKTKHMINLGGKEISREGFESYLTDSAFKVTLS